jgi:hypothetical protein
MHPRIIPLIRDFEISFSGICAALNHQVAGLRKTRNRHRRRGISHCLTAWREVLDSRALSELECEASSPCRAGGRHGDRSRVIHHSPARPIHTKHALHPF